MTAITLYGIKNCDTVRKARRWLDERGIDYRFHDFRADGLSAEQASAWLDELGLALINKRSTRWKTLDSDTRETLTAANAAAVLIRYPTLIKRPVLDTGRQRHLGFRASDYEALLCP